VLPRRFQEIHRTQGHLLEINTGEFLALSGRLSRRIERSIKEMHSEELSMTARSRQCQRSEVNRFVAHFRPPQDSRVYRPTARKNTRRMLFVHARKLHAHAGRNRSAAAERLARCSGDTYFNSFNHSPPTAQGHGLRSFAAQSAFPEWAQSERKRPRSH